MTSRNELPQPGEGLHGEKISDEIAEQEKSLPYPSPLQKLPTSISHRELAQQNEKHWSMGPAKGEQQ